MSPPFPLASHSPPWPDRLAWATLAVVAVIAALTFRDYGLGWDDLTHAQYGELLLSLYTSGFADTRALSFVNLYLYGGGFDMVAALAAKILPFDLFETRRLLGAAVGLIGLAVTWRIGRRLGGPLAGLSALVLLATCPLYYGHMFINPKDTPFAVAMAVFLLGLVRAIEEYPKPSRATVAILGLGFGLAIGSRIMAGFGVLAASVALGALFVLEWRALGARTAAVRLRTFALAVIFAAVLAYAAMALVWPWSAADPLNPLHAIETFSRFFEKPWKELFEGRLIEPPDMPRRYVLVLLGLKLPELFLVLSMLGMIGALFAVARNGIEPRLRAACLGVAMSALLPVAITVLARPAMYNGIRHFVFILPPLAVLGGMAVAFIAARCNIAAKVIAALIFFAGIGLPAIAMARLHPYQYIHFNAVAGGIAAVQSRYMLDYWGLSFKQAGQELRFRIASPPPAGRKWKVAVCGPHPPAQIALGEEFELTWDAKGADFALMLGAFYCAKFDAPLMAEIARDGVILARAYDIRSREFPSLFTLPPVRRD